MPALPHNHHHHSQEVSCGAKAATTSFLLLLSPDILEEWKTFQNYPLFLTHSLIDQGKLKKRSHEWQYAANRANQSTTELTNILIRKFSKFLSTHFHQPVRSPVNLVDAKSKPCSWCVFLTQHDVNCGLLKPCVFPNGSILYAVFFLNRD